MPETFMETVILLHGALGSSEQMEPFAESLKQNYDIHNIDLPGHGGKPIPPYSFSIEAFAKFVVGYIDQNHLTDITIFGYSMGGYVAMYIARHYPDKLKRIITLGTKFQWDPDISQKEIKMLNAEQIAAKVPAFAQTLQQRHAPNDWKEVIKKTAEMLIALGQDNALKPADYSSIHIPCLILLGDRDKMISLEETVQVYKLLPNAQMGMLPNTGHPIEQINMQLFKAII